MQICTSLQTDNHANIQRLSFLQAGYPSYRPTNSVKALKANKLSVLKSEWQTLSNQYVANSMEHQRNSRGSETQSHEPSIDFPGRDVNLATSIIRTAYCRPFWRCVHLRVSLYGPLNNTNKVNNERTYKFLPFH